MYNYTCKYYILYIYITDYMKADKKNKILKRKGKDEILSVFFVLVL
jgi:hypothetical protein